MISRRTFATGAAAFSAGLRPLRAVGFVMNHLPQEPLAEGVSQYVHPAIGTGGHGHCYPGATVPFGMVQLSPDTFTDGWDWCSGYNYSDSSIMGFSHTHLSGTGIGDMLDFLVMPCTGKVKTEPGDRKTPGSGYRSRFSHKDEESVPGYYSVKLLDYDIKAELTATERAGIHRYTFPENASSHVIVDLDHGYANSPGAVKWLSLKVGGNDGLSGGKSTNRWAKGREIFFSMKFSRPFERIDVLADGIKVSDLTQEIHGKSLKVVLHYPTRAGETLLVKTGISGVSAEGASHNLQTEIPDWNFDRIRSDAAAAWESVLSRIRVTGGTRKQHEIFYTAFYHTMVSPTLFDDVDGNYRGMDGNVHKLEDGHHNFSTYSLWDTYRAVHPLYTVALADRVPALVNCLITMATQSPEGMPVWPLQARETLCMTGYHSATVIAEAVRKRIPRVDPARAYAVMKRQAETASIKNMPLYRQYGFIPCDLSPESVSRSLDFSYNDWAVASVAKAAGANDEGGVFAKRAQSYRLLFDKTSGFMRPKLANGTWAEPFANNEMGHSSRWRDYTESNPWQATFAVQHDPAGLTELLGGRAQLAQKLDAIFNASSALPPDAPADISGLVGQYAHGNEPSHHIAYLYVYAGEAHKAQKRLASLMETMYDNQPDGLAGNEDCGQMSAWYVMSAMGFYTVDPVSGNYVFGTPLFNKVTIDTGNGKQFVIEARRASSSDVYISNIEFNGRPYDRLWFTHEDIAAGGRFVLNMSSQPHPEFGSDTKLTPPSASSQIYQA